MVFRPQVPFYALCVVSRTGGNPMQASTTTFDMSRNSVPQRSGMIYLISCHSQDPRRKMEMCSQNVCNHPSQFLLHMVTLLHRPPAGTHAPMEVAGPRQGHLHKDCHSAYNKIFTTQGSENRTFCHQEVRPHSSHPPMGADSSYQRWGQDMLLQAG
jgi:hypothetical protein